MSPDLNKKALSFWKWFKSISADLLLQPTRPDLVHQLDVRMASLGQFDWEIGLFDGKYYLTISPNLNAAKLEITREIIGLCPQCDGWLFVPSKPAKQEFQGIWKMKNEFGRDIWVDSSEWKYVLYQFENVDFDMDLLVNDIDGDLDTHHLAIDIALTGYLGEEEYMRLIKNVSIVTGFADDVKPTSLKYIKRHIESFGS